MKLGKRSVCLRVSQLPRALDYSIVCVCVGLMPLVSNTPWSGGKSSLKTTLASLPSSGAGESHSVTVLCTAHMRLLVADKHTGVAPVAKRRSSPSALLHSPNVAERCQASANCVGTVALVRLC